MTGRRVFAGSKRPTLVTFADPKNPASVREFAFDNPQDALGPDIRSARACAASRNSSRSLKHATTASAEEALLGRQNDTGQGQIARRTFQNRPTRAARE
jgi:hypothetical protein